jgi:hypothetical protein
VEYEDELYAERLRRKAQAAALAADEVRWTDQLTDDVRVKLGVVWDDVLNDTSLRNQTDALSREIGRRTLRSIAVSLRPRAMRPGDHEVTSEQLLSLIEAEHEVLKRLAADAFDGVSVNTSPSWFEEITRAPETFRREVNQILEAHLVGLCLHDNSRLMEIASHEMHNAVVAPTLYLLHSQPRFAAAEKAYQKALDELRRRDPGDAITDAGTALQDMLKTLGCTGNALGDLLKSARNNGLIKGTDSPLTDSIERAVAWVATQRNHGEAHQGDPDVVMSDAWAVVHIVGALMIRLSDSSGGGDADDEG